MNEYLSTLFMKRYIVLCVAQMLHISHRHFNKDQLMIFIVIGSTICVKHFIIAFLLSIYFTFLVIIFMLQSPVNHLV